MGNNMKLGGGGQFKKVQESIEHKEGYSPERAGAIAASSGRKKYGNSKMAKLSSLGRKK